MRTRTGAKLGFAITLTVFLGACETPTSKIILRRPRCHLNYACGELDTLVPAYAATIHESQGSEYPAVVIPFMTQHYAMLQRNLLYTGVTRGKKLVVRQDTPG